MTRFALFAALILLAGCKPADITPKVAGSYFVGVDFEKVKNAKEKESYGLLAQALRNMDLTLEPGGKALLKVGDLPTKESSWKVEGKQLIIHPDNAKDKLICELDANGSNWIIVERADQKYGPESEVVMGLVRKESSTKPAAEPGK